MMPTPDAPRETLDEQSCSGVSGSEADRLAATAHARSYRSGAVSDRPRSSLPDGPREDACSDEVGVPPSAAALAFANRCRPDTLEDLARCLDLFAADCVAQGRAEALAEAARVADEHVAALRAIRHPSEDQRGCADGVSVIASHIRALSTAPAPAATPRSKRFLAWAVEMFGEVALDPKERALRFVEEAIEACHALGVMDQRLLATLHRVYRRPASDIALELAQSFATLECLAEVAGVDLAAGADAEFARVSAIPKAEWEARHAAKTAVGMTMTPAPAAADTAGQSEKAHG